MYVEFTFEQTFVFVAELYYTSRSPRANTSLPETQTILGAAQLKKMKKYDSKKKEIYIRA